MPGTLFIVATPLGNLADLSSRARDTLLSVKVVAAEDTRRTRRLLSHLDAHPRLMSLPAFAERSRTAALLRLLDQGVDVALVTDAGTPGVSDPGATLVKEAAASGVVVIPVPGPSAVTAALSVSGFPADRYLFLGFPPRKGPERRRILDLVARSEWTVVLYEAPPRLARLLRDLVQVAGPDRAGLVARELTKVHEEVVRDSLEGLATRFGGQDIKGEITVVLEGIPGTSSEVDPDLLTEEAQALLAQGLSKTDVVRQLTESWGVSRNECYRLVTRLT